MEKKNVAWLNLILSLILSVSGYLTSRMIVSNTGSENGWRIVGRKRTKKKYEITIKMLFYLKF